LSEYAPSVHKDFLEHRNPEVLVGSEEAKLAKFREVRDQIHEKVIEFLKERNIAQ